MPQLRRLRCVLFMQHATLPTTRHTLIYSLSLLRAGEDELIGQFEASLVELTSEKLDTYFFVNPSKIDWSATDTTTTTIGWLARLGELTRRHRAGSGTGIRASSRCATSAPYRRRRPWSSSRATMSPWRLSCSRPLHSSPTPGCPTVQFSSIILCDVRSLIESQCISTY